MPCDALARDILDPAVISGLDNGIFPLVDRLTGVAKQQPATLITGKKSLVDIPPKSSDRTISLRLTLPGRRPSTVSRTYSPTALEPIITRPPTDNARLSVMLAFQIEAK
jgi:hypothetical protein